MVGQPKHLRDLDKIEADVRVTCRDCGFEVDWTVAALSAHLHAIGGSTVWSEVTRLLACRRQNCGSNRLRAAVVPYARRQPNLPRRISKVDERVIAAALEVLQGAVRGGKAGVDVRLALLVVYVYTRDASSVRQFWERASRPSGLVSETLREKMDLILHTLERRGWLAPQPVAERLRTWPWQSPAPPGWELGANGRREAANDEPEAPDAAE